MCVFLASNLCLALAQKVTYLLGNYETYFSEANVVSSQMMVLKKGLSQLVGKSVTRADCKMGTMLTLDLGPLITVDVETKQGRQSFLQGEGSLWSLLAEWDIKESGEVVCDSSQNSTKEIASFVKGFVDAKLKVWNITEKLDLTLAFDNGYTLSFSSKGKQGETLWTMAIRGVGEFIAEHAELIYKKRK